MTNKGLGTEETEAERDKEHCGTAAENEKGPLSVKDPFLTVKALSLSFL